MDINIEDEDLRLAVMEGIFSGKYKNYKSNKELRNNLIKVISIVRSSDSYETLKIFKSLNCESLKGDKQGLYSIRLGFKEKYRLIFRVEEGGIRILLLEISEHYGDH